MQRMAWLFLLIACSQCTPLLVSEICSCELIKSKADCQQDNCLWSDEKCKKLENISDDETVSVYCNSLDSTSCASTKGCAYQNGICEQFSGCSAYSGSSNDVCQQISQQCTSDGSQCMDPMNCVDYKDEILCNSNINVSGRRCKFEDSKCRELKCIEASTTFTTDKECNNFYPGCLTNGRGCVDVRGTCQSYGENCAGMIGTDGYCEKGTNGCQAKLCSSASLDLTTNEQCAQFQIGCITTGKGCSSIPLSVCATYMGDMTTCQQMIGSDGRCDGTTSTYCQTRKCENAAITNITDELCQNYLSSCITNGRGCVTSLKLCNTYTGTTEECNNYIGQDGKCTLGTTGCKTRICTEAPDTLKTDQDCNTYQNGCVTTGLGCTNNRLKCSTYTGTSITCQKFIGQDGNCMGVGDTNAACQAQSCINAPATYTTHDQCKGFQIGCLSNGVGCVQQTTCSSTIAELSCNGTEQCQWNKICVTNTNCSYYNTQSLCYNNTVDDKPCQWVNNLCRLRLCTDAPTTYTLDEQCDIFLKGCLTNLQGCLSSTDPCSVYQGTKDTCIKFKGNGIKCTSTSLSNAPCIDITCISNTTASDQTGCDNHLFGCKFQGNVGCIDQSEPCTSYYGTQNTCQSYNGVNGTIKCYQDIGVTGNCRNLQCSDNTTATDDQQCKIFLNTCVTKGIGCIEATQPCSAYTGSSTTDCQKFKGNSSILCWWIGGSQCVDKQCSQDTTSISDLSCSQFLTGCVTKGMGCLSNTELCTTYQGNEDQCQIFTGNEQQCVRKNACENRRCSDVINPTSQLDCTTYLTTCRFNGTICIDGQSVCTLYTNLNYSICQQITTLTDGKCYLTNGQTGNCLVRTCSHKGPASSQTDCDSFLTGCIFTGSTCVDKQDTCSAYTSFSSAQCYNVMTTTSTACQPDSAIAGQCKQRICTEAPSSLNSVELCKTYLVSCVYDGTTCVTEKGSCNSYTSFNQATCKEVTTFSLEKCWLEDAAQTTCQSRTCANTVPSPNSVNCPAHKSSCRYDGTSCIDSQTACNLYTSFSQNACQETTLTDGTTKCWRTTNTVGPCQDRACTDVLSSYSTDLCVDHLSTCRYNGTSCVTQQNTCTLYTGFSNDACKSVTTTSGDHCWIPISTPQQCTTRVCSNTIDNSNETNCPLHISTCRYNGSICVDGLASCSGYTSFTQTACQKTTTTSGTKCWKSSSGTGSCEDRNCSNIIINPNYTTCKDHLSTCTYDGSGCYTVQTACNLYTSLTASQCQNVRTTTDGKCWLAFGNGTCLARQCTHNTVATTDTECEIFLTGCKTTGKGCIDSTVPCSTYIGTRSSCLTFTGNGIRCKGSDTTGSCTVKSCQDDMTSTTDIQCKTFMKGCVTRGKGCIADTEPCSSYLGTQSSCQQFTGNLKKCWNDVGSTNTSQCRDRLCTDDTVSNSDELCKQTQIGCVTRGRGCIDETAKCTQYSGTQAECSKFKGENGTKSCWNSSTATPLTACVDRICAHNLSATSDQDCSAFLAGCITKGTGCVAPQPCSSFQGTIKTCAAFSATDKPCKGSSLTSIASCVAVKCNEAPNNYNTDELCNTFKEGCVTNGFGCVNSVECEEIQTQIACQSKLQCNYSGNCRDLQKECSIFKSQSLCVNTPVYTTVGMCAWEINKTTNVGLCRNWTCSDASESIITHDDCAKLYNLCTSKGKGCIQIAACSTYTDALTCSSAKTTDQGNMCIWNSTYCRSLDCTDASKDLNTDVKCQEFLPQCVTNGKGCVSKSYNCLDILIKDKCTVDYQGNTCLWFQKQCIKYSKCTDIKGVSYTQCQQYSQKCTSNGTFCISISPCNKYTNPSSCYVGTDGQCGWIVAKLNTSAQCSLFTKCGDVEGKTLEECQQFSKQCVSDGKVCIDKDNCQTYLTEIACKASGDDGMCFWEEETKNCRLRECKDATVATAIEITTHSKCSVFSAKTPCTTNGTNCVQQGLCTSYKEQGCFYGTDGPCIFTFAAGQIQGTKSCRVKVCSDYNDVSTELCELRNKVCISNGSNCITKANCSVYKTKVACNSGGLDGICVFTASTSDSNAGTCALMTSCDQAKSDPVACQQKYNTCHFLVSLQNGQQITSCINHTCATVANGSICKPIYSFDEKTINVCVTTASGCTLGEPTQLSASTCFDSSQMTYSWNTQTNLCEKCIQTTTPTQNNTNSTNTTNVYGFMLTSIVIVNLLQL